MPAPPPGFEHAPVLKRLGKKEVEIFSQPLWLENILRGNDHHHLFKTIKRGRGEFTFSILSSTIGGSGCSSAMAKETGLMVGDMSAFKEYLRAREGQFIDERGYEANGWTEDWGFVCGTTYYGGSDPQPTKTTGALSGFAHRLGPKGDYEKWRTAVKMLFQYGSLAQQFAVLASFASPLMKLVSSTEGGAIVALISQEPGRGKTTALNAALSVWGEQDVLRIVNSGTPISRGTILARCNNLPCVFDEPDFLNERHNAVELINMHSAGSQRDRANQDGSLQIKSHLGWNNILLMGANKSLWDLCRTTSNDPPSLRVLEFEAPPTDAKNWKENESYFKNAFSENYGHAGDRFLRMIAKPGMVEFLKKEAVVREKHIRSLYTFEPAHRFWVRTLVACDMASTILEQLEPWNDWAKPVLWAADRLSHEQLGREESQNFLDDVKDFIGRFYNNHQGDKSEMSQRRIMRDITELTSGRGQVVAVVIARGPFEDEMLKAGLNVRSTLKLLMKENIIIDKRWDTIGPGPPVRALRIDLRKLAIDLPTDGLEPKHLLSRKSGDPR